MRGKINKYGLLCRELPGRGFATCRCINNGEETARDYDACYYCNDACVAFEGPIPEKRCMQDEEKGPACPGDCLRCSMYGPTGKSIVKICQGRELVFDEFVDERVPK